MLDEPWLELAFLPPALLDDEGRRLWIEEMDFDPRPVFARSSCPTLLFYGSEDSWSPVEPSIEAGTARARTSSSSTAPTTRSSCRKGRPRRSTCAR